ncbi:MAG: hypothetical protein ACI9PC_001563, partial [Porticoccaceae bacterium]
LCSNTIYVNKCQPENRSHSAEPVGLPVHSHGRGRGRGQLR